MCIAAGDEKAFTLIFDTWQLRITNFVFQLTRSRETALEITQELFLKLWLNRASATQIENLNAYLYAAAKNRVLNKFKASEKERLKNREFGRLVEMESYSTEEAVLLRDTKARIAKAIAALPQQQQKVYRLSREAAMTQEEIAQQLGISLETVKKHMVLALRQIRMELKDLHPIMLFVLVEMF